MLTIITILAQILLILFCVMIITSSIQIILKNNRRPNPDEFMLGFRAAQNINISKDELIHFLKTMGRKNVHCLIVDELPAICDAELGAVYIIVNEISEAGVADISYYTVVDDRWLQVDV